MSTAGTIIRIINETGTACCPCPDQTNCTCSPYPTSLACQYKGGIASLCGFEEFSTPSDPPKIYRTKATAGTMVVCDTFDDSSCTPPTCPRNVYPAGEVDSGGCGIITMGGGLTMVADLGGGLYSYEATCQAEAGGVPQGCQVRVGYSNCIQTQFNDGETKTLSSACVDAGAVIWSPFCGTNPQTTVKCMTVGGPFLTVNQDEWDLTTEYGETTCSITQTDNSERLPGLGSECPPNTFDDPTTIPCASVTACYGAGVSIASETTTVRTYEGNGCVEITTGAWYNFDGDVTETLSDQDTFYNAVVRADLPQSWSSGNCIETPAFGTPQSATFTFGYRTVQWRATITNLTAGLTYKTTVRYYRRDCCGSGDFTFFGDQEIIFVASATSETTIWVEIPNLTAGFETVAANATTVSVP